MANSWAANLPVVTVPRSDTAKRVTFIVPYYENAAFLRQQFDHWRAYPPDLAERVTAIVVDDGSPVPAELPRSHPFPVRLFRVDVDVPWNWLAARNIGAHHADDGWLLLTDMDHVVPSATLRAIVWGQHNPKVVYVFGRREHTGQAIPPHSASFLMTRTMFWTIGGYDEALSGHYGTDGVFRKEVSKRARIQILSDALVRYEFVADASTSAYQRKLPRDTEAIRRLVAARPKDWTPHVLSFPYHEVAA